jgi:transcription antitermination factor NusG
MNRMPVLTVPGVIGILGTGSNVTPVPTHEIEAVRRTIESGLPYEPFWLLEPGELVEVQTGPLTGLKGVVVHSKGKYRLVITVTALNDRAVSVEVDRAAVTPIRTSTSRASSPLESDGFRREASSPAPWAYPKSDFGAAKRWR